MAYNKLASERGAKIKALENNNTSLRGRIVDLERQLAHVANLNERLSVEHQAAVENIDNLKILVDRYKDYWGRAEERLKKSDDRAERHEAELRSVKGLLEWEKGQHAAIKEALFVAQAMATAMRDRAFPAGPTFPWEG